MKVEQEGELLRWKTPFCSVTSSCPKLFIVQVTLNSPRRISSTLMDMISGGFFYVCNVNLKKKLLFFFSNTVCYKQKCSSDDIDLDCHSNRMGYAHTKSIVLSFSKFQGLRRCFVFLTQKDTK